MHQCTMKYPYYYILCSILLYHYCALLSIFPALWQIIQLINYNVPISAILVQFQTITEPLLCFVINSKFSNFNSLFQFFQIIHCLWDLKILNLFSSMKTALFQHSIYVHIIICNLFFLFASFTKQFFHSYLTTILLTSIIFKMFNYFYCTCFWILLIITH